MSKRAKKKIEEALTLLQHKALEGLTDKQALFVLHYATSLNLTKAAREAGYAGSDQVLCQIGYENIARPHVRAAIDAILAERVMSVPEALSRLSDHARSDIGELFHVDDEGHVLLNLAEAKRRGLTHLLKKIKTKTLEVPIARGAEETILEQYVEFEMHDSQAAIKMLLQAARVLGDKGDVNVQVNIQNNYSRFSRPDK